MKKIFAPLVQEWESFSPDPSEFLVDGSTFVSSGRFASVHRTTHKRADLSYAHMWDIWDGRSGAIANTWTRWRSKKLAARKSTGHFC